jgi:hypothetical protein
MGATESMRCRYTAPSVRPVLFLFLRDIRTERLEGVTLAGKLVCPGWTKPLPDRRRAELADIAARLLGARRSGRLGRLGSWVDTDGVRAFEIQSVAWVRRQAADGLVVPLRVMAAQQPSHVTATSAVELSQPFPPAAPSGQHGIG